MWHILMLLRRTDDHFLVRNEAASITSYSYAANYELENSLASFGSQGHIPRYHKKVLLPIHATQDQSDATVPTSWLRREGGKRERCATGPVKGEEQVCRVLFCFVAPKLMNQSWIKSGNTALSESFWRDLCDLWGRWSQASWFSLSPMRLQTVWRVLRMPRRNLWAPAGHDFGYFGVFCIFLYCIVLRCTKYYSDLLSIWRYWCVCSVWSWDVMG